MRKYGKYPKASGGTPEDFSRCVAEVCYNEPGFRWQAHQCRRKRGYGVNGLFCKQHSKFDLKDLNIPKQGERMKFYEQPKDKAPGPIEITESQVRKDLNGYYKDIDLAIQTLKDGQRLCTNFAIYWAK